MTSEATTITLDIQTYKNGKEGKTFEYLGNVSYLQSQKRQPTHCDDLLKALRYGARKPR
jgi:hypothetical protein